MPLISASRIHDGYKFLPEGSLIEVTEEGAITGIHTSSFATGQPVLEYEGIICPGFVNAHCHLELSHIKGVAEEGKGLIPFLQTVIQQRNNFSEEDKANALEQAIAAMKEEGIVAVGDIANTPDTLNYRLQSGLHMHTFVESIGFTEDKATERFGWPLKVYEQFAAQRSGVTILNQSIVPHAPYSVSPALFSLINRHDTNSLISIHNEETLAENQYYLDKSGNMKDLFETLQIDDSFFRPSGKTSLQTYLPCLSEEHTVILVHNTFMNEQDVIWLKEQGHTCYLCLCPNANWYIERQMPPVPMFMEYGMNICLGTDSLSSNHQLSIMAEIKTILQHFPGIDMEVLLRWATYNGAKALQMDHVVGSLETGKKPGIVWISPKEKIKVLY